MVNVAHNRDMPDAVAPTRAAGSDDRSLPVVHGNHAFLDITTPGTRETVELDGSDLLELEKLRNQSPTPASPTPAPRLPALPTPAPPTPAPSTPAPTVLPAKPAAESAESIRHVSTADTIIIPK